MTEILNKNDTSKIKEYEDFVENHTNGNFMQSIRWTGVKHDWGYEAVIVRNEENVIIASALILIRKIPVLNRRFYIRLTDRSAIIKTSAKFHRLWKEWK